MTYIVYTTDNWHSYASRDVIGFADCTVHAIHICQLKAKKDNETLSEDDLFNLQNISQTQGYTGEGEFHIEEVQENTLL